ncbi:hypothetical protein JTE90_007258 [Oedothorax gibbosus]|uniref:Uncharacterized protein n=1 Tax=Oedothorax gibbosus TaxID=931172 RepID=A0AAV6VLB5_9ARAC|nr:hypothetical protein JTE90_007258 [Oedothorax gibbosus]
MYPHDSIGRLLLGSNKPIDMILSSQRDMPTIVMAIPPLCNYPSIRGDARRMKTDCYGNSMAVSMSDITRGDTGEI